MIQEMILVLLGIMMLGLPIMNDPILLMLVQLLQRINPVQLMIMLGMMLILLVLVLMRRLL
jgi:hypothetical protein